MEMTGKGVSTGDISRSLDSDAIPQVFAITKIVLCTEQEGEKLSAFLMEFVGAVEGVSTAWLVRGVKPPNQAGNKGEFRELAPPVPVSFSSRV